MYFTSNQFHLLRSAALCALAAFCLLAQPLFAQPSVSSNRYLFIVDTSVAPKKSEKSVEPLRQAMFDMIYSGLRGYMTNGDSYGIWISGGGTDISGGVEVWRHKFVVELAARAALRIKDHGLKGAPSLGAAIADARNVVSSVGDLTVIVITDGLVPIRGTPFDDAINARVAAVAPAIKSIKSTVNIALAAQDGEFVAWDVNSPDFLISLPQLPPRKPKPQVAATTPSDAKPAANEPKSAAAAARAAAKPVVSSKPIVITKETVERDRQITRAMATTAEAELSLVTNAAGTSAAPPTNAPATPTVSNAGATAITATPAEPKTSNAAMAAAMPVTVSKPVPLPVEELPPVVEPAPAATAAMKVPAPAPTVSKTAGNAAPVVQHNESQWKQKILWSAVGAGGFGGVIFVVWFIFRDRRAPSLVSRAAALERLHQPRA